MKTNLIFAMAALFGLAVSCKKINRPETFVLGQEAFGGVVIQIDANGTHGLVASKTDQVISTAGNNYQESLPIVSAYSEGGTGWRIPTKDELDVLYSMKSELGGLRNWYYWSSTKNGSYPWAKQCGTNSNYPSNFKCPSNSFNVRAVKDF